MYLRTWIKYELLSQPFSILFKKLYNNYLTLVLFTLQPSRRQHEDSNRFVPPLLRGQRHSGAEYLEFVSSRSLKMREKYTNWDYLVCIFFEGRAIYVYFYRRKYFLRVSKGGSALKKYTNRDQLSCLSLLIFLSVWGNETKTKYSAPQSCGPWSCWLEPGQKAKLW